jgi:hypothetical protein
MTIVEPGDRVVDNVYQALPDPVDDTLLTLVMNLAAEVWTVRDRLRLVETALAGHGIPIEDLVEEIRDRDDAVEAMRADRDAFVARVMAVLAPRGAGGSAQA